MIYLITNKQQKQRTTVKFQEFFYSSWSDRAFFLNFQILEVVLNFLNSSFIEFDKI